MNRRGFLGAILAAGAAPWVAKAGVLMPVRPTILMPMEIGRVDGIRIIFANRLWVADGGCTVRYTEIFQDEVFTVPEPKEPLFHGETLVDFVPVQSYGDLRWNPVKHG